MENLTITKARERLREIAADLEYYRAVASYEMPESPCPPDVNFDDDDGVRFDKENKKWRRKMKKWDEKFERQMDAQDQLMGLVEEARAIGKNVPDVQKLVDAMIGDEFNPFV